MNNTYLCTYMHTYTMYMCYIVCLQHSSPLHRNCQINMNDTYQQFQSTGSAAGRERPKKIGHLLWLNLVARNGTSFWCEKSGASELWFFVGNESATLVLHLSGGVKHGASHKPAMTGNDLYSIHVHKLNTYTYKNGHDSAHDSGMVYDIVLPTLQGRWDIVLG